MTARPTGPESLEEFVKFFLDPSHNAVGRWPETLTLLREAALGGGPAPIVLPRLTDDDKFQLYVIARQPEETTRVRDLLTSFVGASFAARGDTAPARLDERDPVDQRVREQFGSGSAFVVGVDTMPARRPLREAAELMVRVVNGAPHRHWTAPRPLNRQLADFEAALLGGAPQTAEALLEQITRRGGLSPANLIGLRLKLLAVCGRDADLLRLPGLDRALLLEPPREVKEYVLAAVYGAVLGPVLEAEGLVAAVRALAGPSVPRNLPTGEDPLHHGDAAVAVLLVALHGQGESARLADVVRALDAAGRSEAVPDVLRDVLAVPAEEPPAPAAEPDLEPEPEQSAGPVPLSWADLIGAVANDDHSAFVLARAIDAGGQEGWTIDPAQDSLIAERLSSCVDEEYERIWHAVLAPFLKALLDSREAMPLTLSQVVASSAGSRRDPAGLAVLGLLLTLSLRSAPSASAYRELLDHVSLMAEQWVAPETAEQALDYVDLLLAYAAPDEDARVQCALELLTPLRGRANRLEPELLDVARTLSEELGLNDLGWPGRNQRPAERVGLPPAKVLVYGLDEKVLVRVKEMTEKHHPQVKVSTASDKVGSSSLRQKVRSADRIVMITQCATHAATGFIGQHAKHASDIVYPPGAGSASVYQALVRAVAPGHPDVD
ncbi:hypothetical protein ACFVT9_26170 [Kitasatospora cineracea]|uniref:hypothetical protein n=1 Tax=Kitasatospora cineracea TaxID=88074 RepID=UPI0036D9CD14